MTTEQPEPSEASPEPQPEPLKFDPPSFDYIEKGGDQSGYETREDRPDESK